MIASTLGSLTHASYALRGQDRPPAGAQMAKLCVLDVLPEVQPRSGATHTTAPVAAAVALAERPQMLGEERVRAITCAASAAARAR